jgi:hypothetical protein
MSYTRRQFGKLALAGVPAAALLGRSESVFGALAQARPTSVFAGVQIGAITYSYRSMPDQSARRDAPYGRRASGREAGIAGSPSALTFAGTGMLAAGTPLAVDWPLCPRATPGIAAATAHARTPARANLRMNPRET